MSKVYFTDMRTSFTENLPKKLTRLIDRAGLGTIDFDHKFVAIKIHFGEMGNLAYLRPQYARALAAYIKERGGLPFLTDCNTLYVGSRKNALEHIETTAFSLLSARTNGAICRCASSFPLFGRSSKRGSRKKPLHPKGSGKVER